MNNPGKGQTKQTRQLFGSAAIAHLQSGQELRVAAPRIGLGMWAVLTASLLTAAGTTAWAIFSEIPVTVESYGILLDATGIARVQATSYGQVAELRASKNQPVNQGDILAVVRLGEIETQLEAAQTRWEIATAADQRMLRDEQRQLEDESVLVSRKIERTAKTIASIESLFSDSAVVQADSLTAQASRLDDIRIRSAELLSDLRTQQASLNHLAEQNLATSTDLNRMRSSIVDTFSRIAELETRQASVDLEKLQLRRSEVETLSRLAELRTTVDELTASLQRTTLTVQRAQKARKDELETFRTEVAAIEQRIESQRYVRASASGMLLELPIETGNTIQPGQVVATIARRGASNTTSSERQPSGRLMVTAFFPLDAGKRISLADASLVTPTTVQRARSGSIRARITEVSQFPISVSEATRLVGNQEVLRPLASMGGVLGIQAELLRDDSGNPVWTSAGEKETVDAGTSVAIQVVVERRRPISYLLPALHKAVYGPPRPLPGASK